MYGNIFFYLANLFVPTGTCLGTCLGCEELGAAKQLLCLQCLQCVYIWHEAAACTS